MIGGIGMSRSNLSVGNQAWIDRINAAWHKAATAYIDIGNLLIDAKKTVPHGDWADLLGKLDFDKRTAQKLMEIARDERLSNPSHVTLLPKHWTTLYELSKLPDAEFERALNEGAITKNTQRAEVKKLRGPKPKVTEAEYRDVTESPDVGPGRAASTDDGAPPDAIATATPHGDRKSGDSDRHFADSQPREEVPDASRGNTAPAAEEDPVEAGGAEWKPPHFTVPREGLVPYWIDQDDLVSAFANGLAMAMSASRLTNIQELARCWPPAMPLRSDQLDKFCDYLLNFEAEYRKRYGDGNDAALRAAG
jgi:hypothetical protein